MTGLSTCHFAWAFHSEAEEELLNMIPAMQRGDPQWSELRAVGVGWWIRNINTLRKMVEKVPGPTQTKAIFSYKHTLHLTRDGLCQAYSHLL